MIRLRFIRPLLVTIDLTGHYSVEADITYDSNAGSFQVNDTRAGAYGTDGMGVGGSSAGQFITD